MAGISVSGSVGFVGYIKVDGDTVRATSADVRLSQEINKPDIVAGRYDKVLYWLGPRIVEGNVEFPAQTGTSGTTLNVFRKAEGRNDNGELTPFNVDVRYTNGTSFTYEECIANEFNFSVTQQDLINIRVGLIGLDRSPESLGNIGPFGGGQFNDRILTWADAQIQLGVGGSYLDNSTEHIRHFEININNNAERAYTIGELQPRFVVPKVREITGNAVFLGRFDPIADHAASNEGRCSENASLTFGHGPCGGTTGGFNVAMRGIVYEIEEIAITNDIFETTTNFHALPDQDLVITATGG